MQSVYLGNYPQNDITGKLLEPIEWIVIKEDRTQVLLLSKMIIDAKPFCQEESGWVFGNAWDVSSIRKWLNNTFLQKTFSAEEQRIIIATSLDNHEDHLFQGDNKTDMIYLFSPDEFVTNCPQRLKQAEVTPYAIQNGDWMFKLNHDWWLRLPTLGAKNSAVLQYGMVAKHQCPSKLYLGVRPAMWVKKDAIQYGDSQ